MPYRLRGLVTESCTSKLFQIISLGVLFLYRQDHTSASAYRHLGRTQHIHPPLASFFNHCVDPQFDMCRPPQKTPPYLHSLSRPPPLPSLLKSPCPRHLRDLTCHAGRTPGNARPRRWRGGRVWRTWGGIRGTRRTGWTWRFWRARRLLGTGLGGRSARLLGSHSVGWPSGGALWFAVFLLADTGASGSVHHNRFNRDPAAAVVGSVLLLLLR